MERITDKALLAYVPLLCCLCCGLLFDVLGLFRLTVLCVVVHEAGHGLAYAALLRRTPPIRLQCGGVCMRIPACAPMKIENLILAAGPLCNATAAAAGMLAVRYSGASYRLHFFILLNIILAVFNLLPHSLLDGGRLLQNLLLHYTGKPCARFLRAADITVTALLCGAVLCVQSAAWYTALPCVWLLLQKNRRG